MPALVTLLVVLFLVEKADGLVRPLPLVANQPWDFPGIGLVVTIVLFYIIGLLISTRFGLMMSQWKNKLIGCVPVVRNIFGVTQQVMTSFTSQYTFSRVVFLEWPREGMVAMGFVTGRAYLHKIERLGSHRVYTYHPKSDFGEYGFGYGRRPDRD